MDWKFPKHLHSPFPNLIHYTGCDEQFESTWCCRYQIIIHAPRSLNLEPFREIKLYFFSSLSVSIICWIKSASSLLTAPLRKMLRLLRFSNELLANLHHKLLSFQWPLLALSQISTDDLPCDLLRTFDITVYLTQFLYLEILDWLSRSNTRAWLESWNLKQFWTRSRVKLVMPTNYFYQIRLRSSPAYPCLRLRYNIRTLGAIRRRSCRCFYAFSTLPDAPGPV